MSKKKTPRDYIPSLDTLYQKVVEFVKQHQGSEDGFIETQDQHGDIIYAIIFDEDQRAGVEQYVYGVRVRQDDLQVVLEPILSHRVKYLPTDFKEEEIWLSVKNGDIYYVPTLVNIAEAIEQYVENDKE